ncbi:U3 small nucleolar RNA-associated protein 18 homolog [Geodia barretti]|uniref:U3 small nucleolar RNA-associated protein 18 homolog n=1 Tax=Geodia barretti TaxID=519541 RepID=A0AA35X451_GEOBA|nr:U3 small nucleolar RNA-associated protein 18 homolog [Geodia barretti]
MAKESPKPLRAVMNLTTAVDHLQFNSTSEILAVASSAKKDAVKMCSPTGRTSTVASAAPPPSTSPLSLAISPSATRGGRPFYSDSTTTIKQAKTELEHWQEKSSRLNCAIFLYYNNM